MDLKIIKRSKTLENRDGDKLIVQDVGALIDGKRKGIWVRTYPDGGQEFGKYKDNKRVGKRTTIFPDGEECHGKYDKEGYGQWKTPVSDFLMSGKVPRSSGLLINVPPYLSRRVGGFKNGKRNGKRTVDGSAEEWYGEYKEGKKDGHRCCESVYGDYEYGEYKDDERVGEWIFEVKGGETRITNY